MPPARSVVATVLLSSVLWLGIGGLGTRASYSGVLPRGVAPMLLPANLPNAFWFAPPPQVLGAVLVAGAVHAAVLALLLQLVVRPGARFVPAWFAVIVTGFVATGVVDTALVAPDLVRMGAGATVGELAQLVAPAGLWGVVWGWLPALVGARLAVGRSRAPRPADRVVPGSVLVVAALAAGLVLPALTAAPPPAAPAAVPSPAPTHIGWADIPVPVETAPPGACAATDVTLALGAADAATGHRVLPIRVTNTSGSSCVLDGYADVVFDDTAGDAMNPLVVHGGSFMTTDRGAHRVRLAPGAAAQAELGWNAQSGAGDPRAARVLVSVHPGAARLAAPADLDITSSGSVALTAWHRAAG